MKRRTEDSIRQSMTEAFAQMRTEPQDFRPDSGRGLQGAEGSEGASDVFVSLHVLSLMERALSALTEAAISSGSSPRIYQRIVQAVPRVTNFDASTFSIYAGESEGFRVLGHANISPAWADEVHRNDMRIKSEQIERMFLQAGGESITFTNFDADPVSQFPVSRSGMPGMLMFPVRINKRTWGVLTLQSRCELEWNDAMVEWGNLLGRHCELLIKHAWTTMDLRESMVRESERSMEALRQRLVETIDESAPLFEGHAKPFHEALTPRESEILMLLSSGATNQDIADALSISLSTTKKHVHGVLTKLGLQNRTQAAAYARNNMGSPECFFTCED